MAPNVPELLEAYFGVLKTELEFSKMIRDTLRLLKKPPVVIDIDDLLTQRGELLGEIYYEAILAEGNENNSRLPA